MTSHAGSVALVWVRSLLFHICSGLVTILFLPLLVLVLVPGRIAWHVLCFYVRLQLGLLWVICGQSYRLIGMENAPDGPVILAARHEAMWETLVLPTLFNNPAVVLKKEILRYPVAGIVARKLDYIGVDRSGALDRAKETFDLAKAQAAQGRSILIFPNGTRNPAQRDRVQPGVAVLYRILKLPCLPIVLDSGQLWPYRSWLRHPGQITIRILPVIPTGLRTSEFLTQLETDLSQPSAQ